MAADITAFTSPCPLNMLLAVNVPPPSGQALQRRPRSSLLRLMKLTPPVLLLTLLVLPLTLSLTVSAVTINPEEKSSQYWYKLGREDIEEALHRPVNTAKAKNVILFLGDGMGVSTVTASRMYKGQKHGKTGEEGYLVFDRLPNSGMIKTYNVDKQVGDSAGTATAYLGGVKGNYYTLGVTAAVQKGDCKASLVPQNRVHSIFKWAQLAGKQTGLVTNTRITHASPGAAYGGTSNRDWECDSPMPKEAKECKDLARQLVEDSPGRNINVILGGGRQPLGAQLPNTNSSTCRRQDGRNLAQEWQAQRLKEGVSHAYVTTTGGLLGVDTKNTDYILGLFAESHMAYSVDRDNSSSGQPSLSEMTATTLKRLMRAPNGFVMMVEGGRIDHALHDGKAQLAVEEVLAFDEAIQTALDMVDLRDTLLVVTADHSHSLVINGHPERGNDILGTSSYDKVTDGMEFTTLMFTNGPGYNYTWDGDKVSRRNVTGVNTRDPDFMFQAAVPTKVGWSTHGGEDVAVNAAGPWSHLFHRVHEQSYVAHVMGYAAAIGPYENRDNSGHSSVAASPASLTFAICLVITVTLTV